ncbi:MAG: cohesin domain-containing protein [Planctomycetota bacterium]
MNSNSKFVRDMLLAFSLSGLMPLVAQASSVTLGVGSIAGASGSKVEVPINIRGAQQLGALQIELIYDPAILDAPTVEKGSLPQEITVGHNVVSPGRLRMVMNTSAKESISGDGMLMKAVFLVKGQNGQKCDLRLEQGQAWDNTKPEATPYEMLVTVEAGKFTVGSGLPIALIAGIVGAVVLLIVVVAVARRRKPRVAAASAAAAGTSSAYCGGCGEAIASGARFCTKCGRPVP